ncbi:MAG TPA: sulfotransferase [Acidimicrobiales bacterium]|nr:sulfotransferase [Acidimicrobiales bacterium]
MGVTGLEPALPPPRDPDRYAPVFVLAPARSNSSVVTSMIGMHPQVYGFPELALFRAEHVGGLLVNPPGFRGLGAPQRMSGLVRAIAQLHEGCQDAASTARARAWLAERRSWEVSWVLDHLLELVDPLVGLEKSPEDSNRRDYLARIERCYPRARYLHLTRHPLTTVDSMHRAWASARLWDVPDELLHTQLLGFWLFHHDRVRRFTASLPRDRSLRVRSEDVLNDPRPTLRRICAWLGLRLDGEAIEAMLHPDRSPFARIGPRGALGGNDPGFLADPVPRATHLPERFDPPGEWMLDPWMQVAVVELAAELGYGPSPPPALVSSGPSCHDGTSASTETVARSEV